MSNTNDDLKENPVARLSRDLANASKTLSRNEARFLVDAYYQMQDNRIRNAAQVKALSESGEPCTVIQWLFDQNELLEKQVARALDKYSAAHPVGRWARSQYGIGPVIAAGLLAHIDIEKAPTAGHIWSFAGLNPTKKWEKGQKRPWNAALKVLCWKAGESFVKVSGKEDAFYGKLYAEYKEDLLKKNEAGYFATTAAQCLVDKNYGKETDARAAYESGKLPPAHIHARAKRFAVKMFLSHLHNVWYEYHFKKPAPQPYAIAILGHAHMIEPPHYEDLEAAA